MIPERTDPEAPRLRAEQKLLRDEDFLAGRIGEATYLLSLRLLGHEPGEAQSELWLLREKMREACRWSSSW